MSREEKRYDRDKGRCRYCGCTLELWQAQTDHIIPKILGGRNTDNNLVTCCPRCNAVKGDKGLEDSGLRLYSIEEFETFGEEDAHDPNDSHTDVVLTPPHWFDSWPYEQGDITVNEYDMLYRDFKQYQKMRIARENYIRGRKQLGLDIHHMLLESLSIYESLEKQAEKELQIIKQDYLWPAFEAIKGIDVVLAAGIRGLFDPLDFDSPQKAWKYAGYAVEDGVGQRKKKGQKAGFSVPLKTRFWQAAHFMVESKALDPTFRPLYDVMKNHALENLPEKKGKKGHARNQALRYVAKQFIKYLWCFAHNKEFSRPKLDLPKDWEVRCPMEE